MIEKRLIDFAKEASVENKCALDEIPPLTRITGELKLARKIHIGRHRVFYTGFHTQCSYQAFYIKKYKKTGVNDEDDKRFQKALLKAMQELFGPRSGQGMALCTGRACFKYGLKAYGAELGWFESQFRLRPPVARINAGLHVLARVLRPATVTEICIDADKYHTLWQMAPAVHAAASSVSACHLVTGVLQEFLYWAGGGKYYPIEEKTCILNGAAACLLTLDKHPLD